jgi:hypothetical protein
MIMEQPISHDEVLNTLFSDTALALQKLFKYPRAQAGELSRDYYRLFTDSDYCATLGIPVQDEDFFHHEGPFHLALRAHYYLNLKADPRPESFIKWRTKHQRDLWQLWLNHLRGSRGRLD